MDEMQRMKSKAVIQAQNAKYERQNAKPIQNVKAEMQKPNAKVNCKG